MKNILITGGSGKVGFQLVKHFLEKEFTVITTTTNKERFFNSKQKELGDYNLDTLNVIEVDFNTEDAVNIIIEYLKSRNLLLTDIIHNARSLNFLKMEEDKTISSENFSGEFYMDVVFPYQLSMAVKNQMTHKLENIVFISSMYGVVAPTPALYDDFENSSAIHYGVSKAAQIHLTKELAVRLAPAAWSLCSQMEVLRRGRGFRSDPDRGRSRRSRRQAARGPDRRAVLGIRHRPL